jgi:hypothetical protein
VKPREALHGDKPPVVEASKAMTYSFRNRIILSAEVASPYDINRVVLSDGSADEVVEILGPEGDENLWNAMELRLRGSGYPTREAAIEAGCLWRDRLTIAFAHVNRGIELGPDDTPDLPHYSYGRAHFVRKGRKMRDAPKLVVFASGNEPDWGSYHAEFDHPYAIEGVVDTELAWLKQRADWQLTDKQKLAYEFIHSSLFEANTQSVYILLFTGVEALIPKGFRAAEMVDALARLRANLATMTGLDASAKDSVDLLLEYKENESIRYRGRNFVKLLGDELFDSKTPERFFLHA